MTAYSRIAVLALAFSLAGLASPRQVSAADAQASSASLFSQGESLLRENKPKDAAAVLERAILDPQVDERAWLYLASCYEVLGRYDDAVSVLRKGSVQALRYKHIFFYDMANQFVLLGKNTFAEEMYSQAITVNPSYAPAWLNRANVRIILKDYLGASKDYGSYLALNPETPQRANIEEMLRRLGTAQEAAQAAQLAAEAARLAEEEAKKALLAQVQASLMASASETTSLSTGSGQVQGYGDELNLDQ